ncbi:prepilin-type N-terminal cleavage/methylation domain-containing protein [Sutcliffiella sp. NPDC057660]|uniref:type IV pilus modification PilV family protein n=1 Tax=Sutcliffiella sp. NPDC057660 TaxID=3346199 RepID=UPI0036A5D317
MKKLFKEDSGFTLLEVLISMTILSVVVIGMMSFFQNSFSYVKENESKTVATQVARNVMNYVEKQDFSKMEGYLMHESTTNPNSPYLVEIGSDHCTDKVTILTKSPSSSDLSSIDNVPLFDDSSRCLSILIPLINNITYEDDRKVSIFVTKYNKHEDILELQELFSKNDPTLAHVPESVRNYFLNYDTNTLSEPSDYTKENLLRVFVILNWNEDREDIVIQGVLSHETIR